VAANTQLTGLDGWQIDGKIGIRAPKDSGSGTLFWLQRQDYYDIRLSGPLGRGAARLTGRPGKVSLEVANQGRYEAESPERCWKNNWAGSCRCRIWPGGFAACPPQTARAA
jgi:outer membrane lipoprotein LolB